jgi:hypothetical protein
MEAVPRTLDDLIDPDEQRPTREELLKLVEDMEHDWVLLNNFYNTTARNSHWCGTYEYNQNNYNSHFRVMRLQPREDHNEYAHNREPYPYPLRDEVLQHVKVLTDRQIDEARRKARV